MTTATQEQIEANRLWLTLELLDEDVRRKRERVEALKVERGKASRALERATAPLRDYYEAVSAGERPPDGELENQLRATARQAQETLTVKPRELLGGRGGAEVVDERVEAELAGAARALEHAEHQLARWLHHNADGLAAELWPRTAAARDGFDARWAELRQAEHEWLDVLRLWERLRPVAGVPVAEVPASPLRGVDRVIEQGVPLPMPPSLMPEQAEAS